MSDPEGGNTVSLGDDELDVVEELPEITKIEQDGRRIGRYELVYELGTGGMANVYLARARGPAGFNKWFAIKRIHPHLAKDRRFVRMFLDEARIAAAVQHPNVAQVFDLGEEDGEHYISMEYLHGEHLGALIARAVREWGRLPPALAAALVARAADGLHHAHEVKDPQGNPLGLVHRDVSPHNIFITYDGQVKITDFGVAKAGNRLTNTQTGTLKGKLAYLSPEQALGQEIDRRSDIFALGVVLWEITTGRRLFKAETDAQTLMRVTSGRVRAPSDILPDFPAELEQIILRALASKPDKRYASASAMARDLDRYVASTAEPAGASEVAAAMHQLFPDRLVAKEEILRSEPGTAADTVVPGTPRGADGSSGSGALPLDDSSSKIVPKTESDAKPAPRGKGRRVVVLSAVVVALAALAIG
ncbi:MAG: serine/threonine protein kinase, partial [Polyangiales bacterium]